MTYRPIVLMTLGDPSGSGPELAVKAAFDEDVRRACHPVLLGAPEVVEDALRRIGRKPGLEAVDVETLRNPECLPQNALSLLPHGTLSSTDYQKGVPSAECGRHLVEVARAAARLALEGHVDALCTAPTSKVSLREAGYDYRGLSDVFAEETGSRQVASMLVLDELRIVLATSHLPLRAVAGSLSRDRIVRLTLTLDEALTRCFGIARPRIGVAGLNPHGGESGLYGREEVELIRPAVEAAMSRGVDVSGPIPADFVIPKLQGGQWDGALMMYHDQAHIPLKALGLFKPATLLLGLPIVRTSVAHGTAYGKARLGTADPAGMIHACCLAAAVAVQQRRRQSTCGERS
jgi:4-hydroxythreonine-4-phosphate dehydrogenase